MEPDSRPAGRSGRLRYAAAAGLAAAAVVVRLAIDQVVTLELPYLVFFPAILAAALWFGRGPALFCTLLGGLAAAWKWLPPEGSLAVASVADRQGLALFAVSGALVAWMVELRRGNREHVEELGEREAVTRAVVDTAVDAILTIDERGTVRSFNHAAERMFGYSAAEVLGGNVNVLMPSPYREEHDSYVASYLAGGVKKIIGIGREITARRKDGSTFPMYLSVSEVRLPGRRLFTGFVRDLTEQKRLEQEFLRSQKMEAIGSLSGAIAHDFNNVLMGILACSRLAADERGKDPALRETFDAIAGAASRGVALTRRLLAFSRRAPPSELRPTSLDAVVRENERMLRQLLGEDVDLRIELSAGDGALRGDDGLIEQVVINLLVNARDAMPAGGVIAVSTRARAAELVLEVRDTGCGIPRELRARIFEPFFTTKEPEKGTGLGLSTVKRIVDQLQGRIELESEVGKGTTFRLLFPRCEPAPASAAAAAETCAAPRGESRVLLVEDDRLVRASLSRFLQGKGHTVLAAGSPSEALELARTRGPLDVLVTDMVLPEITGSELASRLRPSAPRMKVVFMSAHPAEALRAQGLLRQDEPYLEKPFEMQELETVLRRVLARGDGASSELVPFGPAAEPNAGSRGRASPSAEPR